MTAPENAMGMSQPADPSSAPAARARETRDAAAGAGLVSVGKMLTDILDITLLVCLTRILDARTFGLLAAVNMVQVTVSSFGNLGLPSALFYFVPKLGPPTERALAAWTGLLLGLLGAGFAAGLWWGAPQVAQWIDKPDTTIILRYIALYVLADFPTSVLPQHLLARRSYRASFAVTLLFGGGRLVSLVVPAALGYDLEGILLCYVALAWARFGVFAFYLAFLCKGSLHRSGWRLRDLFSFGLPLAASTAVARLNREIDKYMIFILFVPAVYGVYTVGAQEVPIVSSVSYAITTALVPTLVLRYEQGDVSGFLELWHGSVVKVATLIMPIFFFCFALADPLVRVIFSDAFAAAAIPFRAYLLLLPLRLCGYGAVVRALGRTRPVLVAALIALVVNATLNYPLFLTVGMAGPALASVLAQAVAVYWLLNTIRAHLDLRWRQVFPTGGVLKTGLVAGLAALPVFPLVLWMEGDAARLLLALPIYLATYLALAWKMGVVSVADLRYLRDLVTFRGRAS